MKTSILVFVVIGLAAAGCSTKAVPPAAQDQSAQPANPAPGTTNLRPDAASTAHGATDWRTDKSSEAEIKPLTAEQQEQLLGARLDGGMGDSFRQFANVFLVSSRIHLGTGVGLMTESDEIAAAPLQSPFPASYQPTLRELLDAIALQTFSQWKYDPSSKYFSSDVPHEAPVEGLAFFEFTKAKREKPFEVTLADGWRAIDKGNWVMHVPPDFPVGLDIYEMGTYSSPDATAETGFADKIRSAVALEWAQRVNEKAALDDLKPAKVGPFDALYYESMIPSQLDKEVKWRQWVFVVDNQCYFVVSTIFPEFEDKIFPDVVAMLASFRIKTK